MEVPTQIKELEEKIDRLKDEKETYIKSQDFEKAAKLRDQERETRNDFDKIRNDWTQKRDKATMACAAGDGVSSAK